jgi:hypothetical protein
MIPWQKVLVKALFEHDAIGVRATVIAHLGHEDDPGTDHRSPSSCSPSGGPRLGSCRVVPVPAGEAAPEVNHIVLVRSDATAEHDRLRDAAICRPPASK